MKLLVYGEDGLTLWALRYKTDDILRQLGDTTPASDCRAFYRPSFGRRGGENSAQFGEFDFILLSRTALYLCESKWDKSVTVKDGYLQLRSEQVLRHRLMNALLTAWFGSVCWEDFCLRAPIVLKEREIEKPLPPAGSLLDRNLRSILNLLTEYYAGTIPVVRNLLLYLHDSETAGALPLGTSEGFRLAFVDCSAPSEGTFRTLDL
ncbi:MAG: hypothetical protein ACYC3S_11185 [Chloroflexota bacterium]